MAIKFKRNETVNKFAGRFLLEAQILYNACAINNFNVNVAMKQAVALYHNLAMIINHVIDENRNAKELVEWMSKSAHLFKEPPLKSQNKVSNPTTGKSFTLTKIIHQIILIMNQKLLCQINVLTLLQITYLKPGKDMS